ncbi:MAG: hypothetical protein H7345_06705 [Rubritepida sp.]|nr:hypothetical protein [Rubritepida sp.]
MGNEEAQRLPSGLDHRQHVAGIIQDFIANMLDRTEETLDFACLELGEGKAAEIVAADTAVVERGESPAGGHGNLWVVLKPKIEAWPSGATLFKRSYRGH